jgi:hypothetical protein
MGLMKILPKKTGYKGRAVTLDSKGLFLLSKQISDEIKNTVRVGVTFFQDEDVKADWYLRFHTDGITPLNFKKDGTAMFSSKPMVDVVLKSVGVREIKSRIRVPVGEMIEMEGMNVYPLITAAIKNQI